MKFIVNKTSENYEKNADGILKILPPCEEAVLEEEFEEFGRIEGRYSVEIKSLDDLILFAKKYGDILILHKEDGTSVIEIYNDYRE